MITLGTVVFVGGILLGWPIPAMVGCILIMAGLVLGVLGATGHPVGQRRHWYRRATRRMHPEPARLVNSDL